jgi:hypothetical protein
MTPSIKASRGETGGGWWDGGVARRSRGWGRMKEGGRRPGGSDRWKDGGSCTQTTLCYLMSVLLL